jgi:hypothetical protein
MELHEPIHDDPHESTREILSAMEAQLMGVCNRTEEVKAQQRVISDAKREEDPVEYLQHLRWTNGEDSAAAKVLNSLFM